MKIFKRLLSIFSPPSQVTPPIKKTIRDLDYIDTVWIKDGDTIYKGMVWDISRRHITVLYGEDKDYMFRINKQEDKIEQDNKILYCNKPDELIR